MYKISSTASSYKNTIENTIQIEKCKNGNVKMLEISPPLFAIFIYNFELLSNSNVSSISILELGRKIREFIVSED